MEYDIFSFLVFLCFLVDGPKTEPSPVAGGSALEQHQDRLGDGEQSGAWSWAAEMEAGHFGADRTGTREVGTGGAGS